MTEQDQNVVENGGDSRTILERLDSIEATLDGVRNGVNTIGGMMNAVAEQFDQMMQKVNSGGLGAILGGLMGGNKNG